jgi:hypothetical protein
MRADAMGGGIRPVARVPLNAMVAAVGTNARIIVRYRCDDHWAAAGTASWRRAIAVYLSQK